MCLCLLFFFFFFFNDTATTEIYTLSLHDALPIWSGSRRPASFPALPGRAGLSSPRSLPCGTGRARLRRLKEARDPSESRVGSCSVFLPGTPCCHGVPFPDLSGSPAYAALRIRTGWYEGRPVFCLSCSPASGQSLETTSGSALSTRRAAPSATFRLSAKNSRFIPQVPSMPQQRSTRVTSPPAHFRRSLPRYPKFCTRLWQAT